MELAHELTSHGLKVKRMKANQKKIERFATFANFSQNGFISIVKNIANEVDHVNGAKKHTVINDNTFFYNELESFDGGRKGHDD
jgi:alanyl-tRNA synthetase